MWNRNIVYNEVGRLLYKGCLTDSQREGWRLLRAFVQYGIRDLRWCAYMLATSFHETGAGCNRLRSGEPAWENRTGRSESRMGRIQASGQDLLR